MSNSTTAPIVAIMDGDADALVIEFANSLDRFHAAFRCGVGAYQVMADLFESACAIVGGLGREETVARLRDVAKTHPVARYIYQCPFTRHSFEKPRGYAGDAELIDYIYAHDSVRSVVDRSSPVGRGIMLHNIDSPAAAAVRARRHIIAGKIADVAERVPNARILSVACGHARELELVDAAALERVGQLIGFDQDVASLAIAERQRVGQSHLAPRQGTIVELMKDPSLTGFDLIYAAGLFDYLSDRLCRRLTKNLFARLNPGGQLIVANFLPGVRDVG